DRGMPVEAPVERGVQLVRQRAVFGPVQYVPQVVRILAPHRRERDLGEAACVGAQQRVALGEAHWSGIPVVSPSGRGPRIRRSPSEIRTSLMLASRLRM